MVILKLKYNYLKHCQARTGGQYMVVVITSELWAHGPLRSEIHLVGVAAMDLHPHHPQERELGGVQGADSLQLPGGHLSWGYTLPRQPPADLAGQGTRAWLLLPKVGLLWRTLGLWSLLLLTETVPSSSVSASGPSQPAFSPLSSTDITPPNLSHS